MTLTSPACVCPLYAAEQVFGLWACCGHPELDVVDGFGFHFGTNRWTSLQYIDAAFCDHILTLLASVSLEIHSCRFVSQDQTFLIRALVNCFECTRPHMILAFFVQTVRNDEIEIYVPVSLWACEPVNLWACEPVSLWACEPINWKSRAVWSYHPFASSFSWVKLNFQRLNPPCWIHHVQSHPISCWWNSPHDVR